MDSTTFRRVYASLRESVEVTVNGHVIGTWMPVGFDGGPLSGDKRRLRKALGEPRVPGTQWQDIGLEAALSKPVRVEVPFGVSRPAPKPGKTK